MPTRNLASRLNKLEIAAINAEDAANDVRWDQAKEVQRLIDAGHSQRDIAAEWINGRSGEPYAQSSVKRFADLWKKYGDAEPHQRPEWAPAFAALETSKRTERAQQQPPQTEEAAEKLAENIIKKAPKEVRDIIEQRLYDAKVQKRYVSRAERKAAEAEFEDKIITPMNKQMDDFTAVPTIVTNLKQAAKLLDEMIENQTLDDDNMMQIEEAASKWNTALQVAQAMVGIEHE